MVIYILYMVAKRIIFTVLLLIGIGFFPVWLTGLFILVAMFSIAIYLEGIFVVALLVALGSLSMLCIPVAGLLVLVAYLLRKKISI